jgi:hypothetical protein
MPLPRQPVFQWRLKEYDAALHRVMLQRTYRAATHVQQQTQRNLRIPFSTEGPSKEHEFPHARTGLLLKSIQIRVEPQTLRGWIYTNLSYGLFLEWGTVRLRFREFLRRTLFEEREKVKEIFTAPLPTGLVPGKLLIGK